MEIIHVRYEYYTITPIVIDNIHLNTNIKLYHSGKE